ncbi:MAG TPA: hypothetical protein V6C86_26105 [Oculatellaceae cyanobacterium]
MALAVEHLSTVPKFNLLNGKPAVEHKPQKALVNSNRALDWMASQIAVIIGFEDGRISDQELEGDALAFAGERCEKSDTKFDFLHRVGDRLSALRPDRKSRLDIDESLEAVWLPKDLFSLLGGEVFDIDPQDDNKIEAKASVRERRADNTPKTEAEDQRQQELAAALRWVTSVTLPY